MKQPGKTPGCFDIFRYFIKNVEKFKEIWYNSRNHIRRFSGKRKDIKSLQYLMGHKESEPVEPYTKRPQKYGDLRRFS